jgi:hypothetical protein
MTPMRRRRLLTFVVVGALAAATAVFLFAVVGTSHFTGGPFPDDLTKGDGPTWANESTGASGGPDYESASVPFESSHGCGYPNYSSSISYLHGWYVQSWNGPRNMVTGRYLASTALPKGAVFTGWSRPNERLWFSPTDRTHPGEYRYLFVERTDHVERWPRATFGCA